MLIIGASGKAFCSGHDLRDIKSNTRDLFTKCSQTMISINNLPQPVIAMVNGVATAAGCQLVASCDLAVASEVRCNSYTMNCFRGIFNISNCFMTIN